MSNKYRRNSSIDNISESKNNSNDEIKEPVEKLKRNLRDSSFKFNLNHKDSIKKKIMKANKLNIDISKVRRNSVNEEKPKSHSKRYSLLSNITSDLSTPKKGELKSPKKKKKNKKKIRNSKLSLDMGEGNTLLTEVKINNEKKVEESRSFKYLKNKLNELKLPHNFQTKLKSSFEDIHKSISNINLNSKINTIEELIPKNSKLITINNIQNDNKGIKYDMNKNDINRLINLRYNNSFLKKELSKIKENKKIIENVSESEKDFIGIKINNDKLKKFQNKENDLLNKIKENKFKIQSLIEDNKEINRKQILFNYLNNNSCKNIISNNIRSRNNKNYFLQINTYYSLNDEQKKFNRQLFTLNKESLKNKEKFEKDLKASQEKKIKELDLKQNEKISQKINYLNTIKSNEKKFFNKMKSKNDLILLNSNRYINEKKQMKEKDYLFNKLKEKFENSERKIIDKTNMTKKDALVTKKELNQLSNRINAQKKVLEEGLIQRNEKMKKMWKERSQRLPVYKHPIVDILEDEEFENLETKEEEIKRKEKNNNEKKNYKPPEIKISKKLKEIREKRNIKTTKESLQKTENNNKYKILRGLNYINKNNSNSYKKVNYKKENEVKINKPEKPIDYLKILVEENKNKKNKRDIGVGNMLYNSNKSNNKNKFNVLEYLELNKLKSCEIDKKVMEKKLFLKLNGGYLLNTKLGDEVGNLIIESIQSKLNMLKKLNNG